MATTYKDASTEVSIDRNRVQVDFTSEAYERLQQIKDMAGVKSNTETIRNALRLYDWYLQKRADNCQLLLAKGDVVKEVELLL